MRTSIPISSSPGALRAPWPRVPGNCRRPESSCTLASVIVALLVGVMAVLVAAPPAEAANDCSTDCTQTACSVDCTEADLRDAVRKAKLCARSRLYTGRTIRFNTAAQAGSCTISLLQDGPASRVASCRRDPERYAVCLKGHHITIDGENRVTFTYGGPAPCQNCSGECPPPQPGLFTLKGEANTLKNFTMEYFPEGIQIRAGNNHTVSGVTSRFICEDAITIDATAGTGQTITGCTLAGNTTASGGHTCYDLHGSAGLCGIDKAIQVNGGTSTITANTLNTIGQPVNVVAGAHAIAGNSTMGDPTDQNVCQGYTIEHATVTMTANTIDHCKFGIRLVDDAVVEASGNTITNGYVSAFQVKGTGTGPLLKGTGNRIRNSGFFTHSDCQRGALVLRDNPAARVDFGGGDFSGAPVIGSVSSGGNVFCQGGLNAIWNITDCPCAASASCSLDGACPVDGNGACTGSGGGGAAVGAQNNCFDALPPQVQDTAPSTSRTDGATACDPAQCQF